MTPVLGTYSTLCRWTAMRFFASTSKSDHFFFISKMHCKNISHKTTAAILPVQNHLVKGINCINHVFLWGRSLMNYYRDSTFDSVLKKQ